MTRWLLAAWLLAAAAFVGQAPQQPSTTFRSGTTIVEVDVIARDKDGRFVSDLRAEDFEVLEDGVPQEVSVVYRVVGPAEPPPGDVGASPVPPPQQVQRVLVFFFDHHHMAPGSLERARKAALDFLQRGFREGDVGGVLNGPVLLNNRLTSSREEIEQALRSVKPAGDPGAVTRELRQWPRFVDLHEAYRVVRNERGYEPGASTALAAVVNRACREQPDQCEGGRGGGASMVETQVQGKATQLVEFARSTARQTIDTVGALSNGLGRLPGRKTVIMLTEGFFTEESWADLRSVVGRAARASVRIYAVDTRGLNRGSASSDIISAPSPSQPELSAPALSDPNADAPNSLAVDTGGFAIRNENDFGKAFAAIDRDTSSYYILGFRSTKPHDGTFRSLAVRVKRAGIAARARRGYLAAPLASAAEEKAVPADNKPPGEPPPARPAAETGTSPVVPASPPPAPAAPLVAVRAQPRVAEHVDTLEGSGTGGGALPPGLLESARTGWEAYQKGDVVAARAALRPAAAHASAPAWARYVLGWAEYASANYAAATAAWELVRGGVPDFKPVYFDLADGYLQQKEFGKAVAVLRDAQQRWPADVEVYNAIGVIQAGRGALNDAVRTLEQAVAVNPSDATAWYNLARSLELRFVQLQRLGKASGQAAAGSLTDRDRAVDSYRRTVQLGGPNVEPAKEGLKRLGAQ